jgi:uncharacterized protein YjbI with pentapeptide repeats
MANQEHLAILKKGVEAWNRWRQQNPEVIPDLRLANLIAADFHGASLDYAVLGWANLERASGTRRCNRSGTGNLRRFVPSCSQYREQEQLCGAKLGEGIVTAQLVTIKQEER